MAHGVGVHAEGGRAAGARTTVIFLAALLAVLAVVGFGIYVVATWGLLAFIALQAVAAVGAVLVKDVLLPALRQRR